MTSDTQLNYADEIPREEVIAIMGMTGSGKSTFLNLITDDDRFKVGHHLKSETATLQEYQFHYDDEAGRQQSLCIIDTPGFGDTYKLDSETLGVISAGLMKRPKITGIIYLHNIVEPRLTHLGCQATEIFYDVCGEDTMKNVILCTSQWDNLKDTTKGESREAELIGDFWKQMIEDGARTARHDNTPESAGEVFSLILGRNPVKPKLVAELEVPDATLKDTSAGKLIGRWNAEKGNQIEQVRVELEETLAAQKMKDEMLKAKKAEEERERAKRVSEMLAQIQEAEKQESERVRAKDRRKELQAQLKKEKGEWEAQRKAEEKAEAKRNAKYLRTEAELKRLEDESKRTQAENANLEKPFDVVDYSRSIATMVMGHKLGRVVGGFWGYIAKASIVTANAAASVTGGKKFGERTQEAMENVGGAILKGHRDGNLLGATVGLAKGSMKNTIRAIGDIFDRK